MRGAASLAVALFALVAAVSARGDTSLPSAPPGWEEIWPSLSAEEQAGLSEVLNVEPLDPRLIAESMRGVPEGPTPEDLAEAASDGHFGPAEGILESTMSLSPVRDILVVENQWRDITADGRTDRHVYAGSSRDDRARGMIVLVETPWPPPQAEASPVRETVMTYRSSHGPLRIVAEHRGVLELRSEESPERHVFNPERRELRQATVSVVP